MACFESGTVVTLSAREALTLPNVRGATLRVTKGALWLTEERARDDIVLRPGDNWLVESNGNTVVEAQGDTTFRIVGLRRGTLDLPLRERQSGSWLTMAAWFLTPHSHLAPHA